MKKWKSLLAMVLCFAILIPVIMQNSICVRAEESAENDGSTLVKCVKLFSADGNREITTGSAFGFGDTFLIRYYFVDLYPRDFEGNITNFVPNVVYSLPDVPKEIQSADGANLDWSCRLEDGVTPLGEASYQNQLTGNMKMTFAEELAESDCITGAYLQLSVKLNQEQCGSALEKQISLPGVEPTTITIGLTDNQPTAPEMQKTGAYNESTKQIDWVVTLTEGSSVYGHGLCLKDTFDDKQDFVTGSFRVTEPGGTPQSPATGFDCTENVISYEFIPTNTRDNVWTFQYSTSVKDTAIIEEGMLKTDVSVVLENDAKLLNQEDNSIISEDTDTVTKDFHYNWLTKTSSVEGCSPGEVKWTLTVDSNGYPFDNITVYDKVTGTPVDSTPKCQILYDDSSISYTNTVSTPVVEYASAECIATSTIQQNGQSYAMKIDLGAIPAGTGAITITYKTKVTNYGEYIRHNQPQVNNSAWLTYQWPDYNGTGESIQLGIPTLKVPSPIVSSMITKSDGVYDKSTHEITWKVEVNRNKSNLDNLSVKDIIGEGQEFVRFQNLMIDYVDTDLTSYPVDETETGKKTLHFGSDLDGKTAVFEVVTKLTDQDYFENNVTETGASGTIPVQTFVNKVKLYQGADCISSDDGTVKPINTVFTKKTPDYNYATKTLSWKLEVNQDKMALSEPVITDVIPTGLILDQEHIYLRSSSGEIRLKSEMEAAGVKPYYTYDETSHRLSVCLNDFAEGDAAQTICFDTKIDVEHAEFEGRKFTEYSGDITISNTAELHKSGSSTVASTGKIIIDNQLLKKSGTKDTGTSGQGDYRVVMNQPGIMLPAHTQVIDILSPGMRLNLPSLKLYEAAVNPDGTVNAIGAELTNYTYTTEILASGNAEGKASGSTKLVLQLPENPGNKIYLMSYQAIVTDTTFSTYKNEISMTGVAENSQGTDVVMSANMLFGSGGGSVSASSMVEVTKYNADGTTALPGAVFALIYQDNGGNEHIIDTGTTGVDGKLTFRSLEVGTRYTVKEIEAPAGYELGTEVAKDFVAPEKGYTKREQLTFYNESKKATLQFKVKNSTGSPILGARFSLWRVVPDPTDPETNLETKIDEIESDNEGIVCFRLVPTGAYLIKEEAMTSGYLSSNLPIYANVDSLGSLTELYRVEEDGTRVDLTVESVIPEASPSVPGGDSGTTPPGTDGGDSGTTPPGTEGGDGGTTPPGTDGGDGGITPPGTDGGDVGITPPGTEGGDGGTTPPDTGSGDSEITPPDTGSGDSGITPTGIANINSVTTNINAETSNDNAIQQIVDTGDKTPILRWLVLIVTVVAGEIIFFRKKYGKKKDKRKN